MHTYIHAYKDAYYLAGVAAHTLAGGARRYPPIWRCSFQRWTCVPWLVQMSNNTQTWVYHDAFTRVAWLIHMRDMTHSYVWHYSSIRFPRFTTALFGAEKANKSISTHFFERILPQKKLELFFFSLKTYDKTLSVSFSAAFCWVRQKAADFFFTAAFYVSCNLALLYLTLKKENCDKTLLVSFSVSFSAASCWVRQKADDFFFIRQPSTYPTIWRCSIWCWKTRCVTRLFQFQIVAAFRWIC